MDVLTRRDKSCWRDWSGFHVLADAGSKVRVVFGAELQLPFQPRARTIAWRECRLANSDPIACGSRGKTATMSGIGPKAKCRDVQFTSALADIEKWTLITQQRHCLAFYVAARSESQLYQNICLSRSGAVSSAAGGRPVNGPLRFPSRTPATAPRFVCQPPGPSVMM